MAETFTDVFYMEYRFVPVYVLSQPYFLIYCMYTEVNSNNLSFISYHWLVLLNCISAYDITKIYHSLCERLYNDEHFHITGVRIFNSVVTVNI